MTSTIPQVSPIEGLILELLLGGDLFGLELVERSEGRLKRGTVYVTLGRMQGKGYLESWAEALPSGGIGLPRRRYRPTTFGLRVLAASTAAALAFADHMTRG
jgi:DNA-binding PadR family transcriptional regulator